MAKPLLLNALTVFAFAVAFWLLHHELQSIRLADVKASFHALSWTAILLSLVFTALNFVVLIGYDLLGTRLVNHPLNFRQVATVSLLYYAFSNALGTLLGGTPVRLRLYSNWGMPSPSIVRMLIYIAAAFWMGLFVLGGVLFVAAPFRLPAKLQLPIDSSVPLGCAMLIVSASYLILSLFIRRPVQLWKINFQPPPFRLALAQVAVAVTDLLCASAALYVLLPNEVSIGYWSFTAVFVLAIIVSLISHVPGGLGVLELVMLTMLGASTHHLIACLLAFRVVYYLLPLLCAVVAVAIATVRQHSSKAAGLAEVSQRWSNVITPRIITGAVFVAGVLLLVSGALPAGAGRMQLIRRALPLPLVELSHLTGSIVGALLIVLARALQRRIDAAWALTVGLLAVGVVVSLVKGFDYEEASILLLLLLAILPCREHFYRTGRLFALRYDVGWTIAVTLVIALLFWILLFAYRHVEYHNELWWQFAFHSDAPRSLRALLGAAVALAIAGAASLLQPNRHPTESDTLGDPAEIATLVQRSRSTTANLALLGDKRFVFSDDRTSAVMFGCQGKSWIAMGDPIGEPSSAVDAAWNFREACDAAGAWPVFYQVSETTLGRYIEMGLSLVKIGEEARVRLPQFSLDGSSRKDFRRTKKRTEELGLRMEIIPRAEVDVSITDLQAVSDVWLASKSTAEKGFSLGYFDARYLSHFDIAVIRNATGGIEAFANVWSADKEELSVDLMRYRPSAPDNVMEYLFIELMLYGKAAGYAWFNIGMAPLAGVDGHRLGTLWNRMSSLVYRHGEHFYNFQGLRNYKQKYDPEWSPKYLAFPSRFAMPQVLANLSALISGGLGNLIHK